MEFTTCQKCGLSLPRYMIRNVSANGKILKICVNCLKKLKSQFRKGR